MIKHTLEVQRKKTKSVFIGIGIALFLSLQACGPSEMTTVIPKEAEASQIDLEHPQSELDQSFQFLQSIKNDDVFPALVAAAPGDGFLTRYLPSGQPTFDYTKSVTKRFGPRLNKGVDPSTLPSAMRTKWQKIYAELVKIANRTIETPQALLVIDLDQAKAASIAFEKTGAILPTGAWTIAVEATAVRHGFPKTPCAEFMSEVVREAYKRAGYRVTDDFSPKLGIQLIWSNSAAVVNFSKNLYKSGWIPWDSRQYRPPVGALMMNGAGETPGHTYMAAGDDGRFIIDNGAPQGRDLRTSSESIIGMMFEAGVFFLPPGVNPRPW